jgi:hypothetical protein
MDRMPGAARAESPPHKLRVLSYRPFSPALANREAAHTLPKAGAEARTAEATDFIAVAFFFCVFRPKNACQVPKPPKSLKQKEIEVEV